MHSSFFFKIVLSNPSWLPWPISCHPCKVTLHPVGDEEPSILGYFIGIHTFSYLLHVNGVCFSPHLSLCFESSWETSLKSPSRWLSVYQPHPDSQVCSFLTSTATTQMDTCQFFPQSYISFLSSFTFNAAISKLQWQQSLNTHTHTQINKTKKKRTGQSPNLSSTC